jgi:cytochrome P450
LVSYVNDANFIIRRAMAHEEAMYANPDEFCPDRFRDSKARDPRAYIFGFGRRFVSAIGPYR